jgi:hypothetical protein
MGILNLKKKTAFKFIKNKQNNRPEEKKTAVREINKVGVLAEIGLFQTYDFTKRLCSELGIEEEEMTVFLFDKSAKDNSLGTTKVCNENSFGLYGKIKSPALTNFVEKKFDLLINYCEANLIYDQIIMIRSEASLKVGFEHESNHFNDISFKVEGNKIDTFNNELVKYLEILKLIKN